MPALTEEIARQLSVGDRMLSPSEVSLRIIECYSGSKLVAPAEIEITARAYKERIEKIDQICMHLKEFILSRLTELSNVQVWLVLAEIGHNS
jgi:hypothetical protein